MPPKNRPKALTIGRQPAQQEQMESQKLFDGSSVVGGMNTFQDPVNIDPSQWVSLLNVTNRNSKLSRRAGGSLIGPAKPDSNEVLSFYTTTLWNGDAVQLRFTPSTLNSRSGSVWNLFGGESMTGGDKDRIRIINFIDRIFFSNNGVDPIREVNLSAQTIDVLGNAPRFKYICAIADRIVGAYLIGDDPSTDNPTLVGWSGDINLSEWDPNTDFSAGSNPLYESQSQYSEFITGIFGFETVLLVMRQRSIVMGTLQASATDPFYFFTAVPGVGSDSPDTIQQIPGGLIWYDYRTRMVYQYAVAQSSYGVANGVNLIGLPISETLTNQITDNTTLFSSFDPINLEYQLCIPVASSNITRIWTYNLKMKAWSFDEVANVSSIDNVEFSQANGTIGDLVGTIGDLIGTIEDLSPNLNKSTRFYSLVSGDIEQYDATVDQDNDLDYTTTIESKVYELPVLDASFQRIRLEIIVRSTSILTLSYSKDNGVTWSVYKTITLNPIVGGLNNQRQLVIASKHIRSRQLKFKIDCSEGLWDIVGYEVHYLADSPSRK